MGFVTCSHKAKSAYVNAARIAAAQLGWSYVERGHKSIGALIEEQGVDTFLLWGAQGPMLCTGETYTHAYHLSMAQLRLLRLQRGEGDRLVEAIQRFHRPGNPVRSFLDATLGLGSDSLVASYALGEDARILGIEGCPPLAFITNWGCRHFHHEEIMVTAALRRIQVLQMSYEIFLQQAKDRSVDIVYFDPMFEMPVVESPQFVPLRQHIVETPLSEAVFREACRVARRGVIIKERPFSPIFSRLGITEFIGGRYSRVAYGIYEVEDEYKT